MQYVTSNRQLQVKNGTHIPDHFLLENSALQDNILSPVLSNAMINNNMKSVFNNANASLFVNDFVVCIYSKLFKYSERNMQLCTNRFNKWVTSNGFKFSVSKTICVHSIDKEYAQSHLFTWIVRKTLNF